MITHVFMNHFPIISKNEMLISINHHIGAYWWDVYEQPCHFLNSFLFFVQIISYNRQMLGELFTPVEKPNDFLSVTLELLVCPSCLICSCLRLVAQRFLQSVPSSKRQEQQHCWIYCL